MAVLHRVFCRESATRLLRRYQSVRMSTADRIVFCIESDAIWHGPVNPRGMPIWQVGTRMPRQDMGAKTRVNRLSKTYRGGRRRR
jgi:hypothetical protein